MTGTRYIDITDPSREETLGKKQEKRKIAIRFYYPGMDDTDKRPCDLLTETKRKSFGKKPDFTLYDQRIRIYEDLAVQKGSFPLVLFSHGYNGFMEQNSDLCQYLAKHGYIIASIGHSYEGAETLYSDQTSTLFERSLYPKMFRPLIPAIIDTLKISYQKLTVEEALTRFDIHQKKYESFMIERIAEWAQDDRFVLNKIRELNQDQDSFLYHRIDFSNGIGVTGHSFGGATAYYHCIYDDIVSCGINMDGALYGDFAEAINHKPFMQMNCKMNVNVSIRSRFYHDKPFHSLLFKDMQHSGFSDLKLASGKASVVGKSDPVLTLDTVNEAHLAFFERYLRHKDSDDASPLPIDQTVLESYEIL